MNSQLHDSGPMFLAPASTSIDLDLLSRYERCEEPNLSFVEEPQQPKVVETRARRIVRAVSGATEIRLLHETEDGVHVKYILAHITISPYAVSKQPLMTQLKRRDSGDLLPMGEVQALKAFDTAVSAAYPSLPTRGGKMASTCIHIL